MRADHRATGGEEINRLLSANDASRNRVLAQLATLERLLLPRLHDCDQRDIVKDVFDQLRALTDEWRQLARDPLAGFAPQMLADHPDQVLAELKRRTDSYMRKGAKLMRELNDFTGLTD
jgi:hypothetical protein